MKWLFLRPFPASGGPVCFLAFWNRCSNRTKTFHHVLRVKILTNSWSHFGSLSQGFLRSAILNEEKALKTRLPLMEKPLKTAISQLLISCHLPHPRTNCCHLAWPQPGFVTSVFVFRRCQRPGLHESRDEHQSQCNFTVGWLSSEGKFIGFVYMCGLIPG